MILLLQPTPWSQVHPATCADHETGMIEHNLEAKYPHKEKGLYAQTTPPQPPTELAPQQTDHGEKKKVPYPFSQRIHGPASRRAATGA